MIGWRHSASLAEAMVMGSRFTATCCGAPTLPTGGMTKVRWTAGGACDCHQSSVFETSATM